MFDPKIIFPYARNNRREAITCFDETTDWGYMRDGKDYIDLSLGSCGSFPLGFKRKDFLEHVSSQAEQFVHLSGEFLSTNRIVAKLAEEFDQFANGYKSIFTLSGSDAVETAIRVARVYHPSKRYMLGMANSYHGSTFMSSSISGSTFLHDMFGRHPDCVTVSWDLQEIEAQINSLGADDISCLIIESCSWQNGLHTQSDAWWKQLRALCTAHDIILIIDDIAFCGAKTTEFFGYNKVAEPDIVCFGKGISGGYFPLSGTLVSDRIFEHIKSTKFLHGFTYSFSMTGILSALYYIDIVKKEGILEDHIKVKNAGTELFERLKTVNSSVIDIRNYGLMWCLDLELDSDENTITDLFLTNGLYVGLWNDIANTKRLLIQLPVKYDQEYFDTLASRLHDTLKHL